jgi:muramidase (phage lysozyme)
VFKSGVVSGVKAAQNARQKAESDVGDFAQQERDLDALNDAAAGGGKGAIVPFTEVFSNEKPPVENVRVNVDDASPQEAEESKESFKDALKKLLETLKRITNLKNKQKKSSKKTDNLKGKKKKEKKKERKTPGRDIFGVGRKIKGKVANVFGDIFGMFGDIIAFAALNWISNPKNKKAVKGIIAFMGHAFKFINSFASFFIDNTLTGLSQLLGPDSSIGDRISGALKLIGSFFMLKWMRNPFKIIKDVKKLLGIFKKFGKFVNKIFGKPVRMIQNFVQKSLNKTLGKTFMSKLFKPLRRFIIQVGGKSLFKLLGAVGRGFTKMISRIPFVGALLEFFLDVFVFKKPPTKSAFKAIGSALVGSLAAAVGGPFGAFLGGWIGGGIGEKIYDGWFGSGPSTDKEDDKDTDSTQSSGDATVSSQKSGERSGGGYTGQVPPAGTNAKALLNTIRFAEGTSHAEGYNTWFGGRTDMDLTSMTINEVVQEQKRRLSNGEATYGSYTSAAVGAYQMMEPEVFAVKAGYDPSTTKFTPEVQDRMAIAGYMKGQARMSQSQIDAPISREQIAQIAPVWASLPMMNGQSRYNQPVKSFETLQAVYNKSLGQGGGLNPVSRRKISQPKSAMLKKSSSSSMMPSMSTEFAINEKIKTNNIIEQPIIINNGEHNVMSVNTTGITTLNKDKPTNPVLSRL